MTFLLKQYFKMFVQGVLLPAIYFFYRHTPIDDQLVIFADAHHNKLPFSMERIYSEVAAKNFNMITRIEDYQDMNIFEQLYSMISFMKIYARAKYIFICDYYLPVSSCKKKPETIVIQLLHSGGLLKTFGYDASDDIPPYYKLNPYKNYSLVTVSAKCCVPVLKQAMKINSDTIIQATGISRSDCYFDPVFISSCKETFIKLYSNSKKRKILLWAPTFRGNASTPYLVGEDTIRELEKQLGGEWLILIKVHPYLDKKRQISNCPIPSEYLLPVVDLLITDYSSILFDYILFEKPFILFAPDYEQYKQTRGFYIDYHSLPGPVITESKNLIIAIQQIMSHANKSSLSQCRDYHMGECDGQATKRILNNILNM